MTYTTQGDLAATWTPPIVTTLNGVTTTAPVTTSDSYDADGNRTSLISANNFGTTNATTFGYDHLGRLISTTLPQVKLYTGTTATPEQTTGYDGEGNVVQQVDGNGDATINSYDPLDRLVATTNPVSGTTLYTYTAAEKVAEQDPAGNLTTYSYDPAGRLILTTDPQGNTTQSQYDPVGNTVAITMGNPLTVTQVETRAYDALNEVITQTLLAAGQPPSTTVTAYDLDGNVAQVQQPNGDVTFNTYDLADQLTTVEVDAAPVSGATNPLFDGYAYDQAGNLIESTDFDLRDHRATYDGDSRIVASLDVTTTSTVTTTTGYDPDGNTISQIVTSTVGQLTRTRSMTNALNAADWTVASADILASAAPLLTTYGYDGAGQQRTTTVIDGVTPVTTTVDAEGRTTAIAEGVAGSGPYTTTFGYNPDDLPISATLPNQVQVNAGYDVASRLTSVSDVGPTGVSTRLNSQYAYGYNPLGWTTAVTTTLNGISSTQTITHDALGRVIAVSKPSSSLSGSYDGNGNLLTWVNNGSPTTYTYSSVVPNELQSSTAGGTTTYYGYDQNGDTTSITSTGAVSTSLSYDSQARLTSVTLKNGTTVSLGYDAAGQRSTYVVSRGGAISMTEQLTYRGDALAQAVISDTQKYTDTYLYTQDGLPLELIRQVQGGSTNRYWYVLDGRHNVVALTDMTGTVVDSYSYDLWGKLLSATEAVPQRLRYAGYWYDQELGWYAVGTREYAPGLMRWLQPDASAIDGVRTYVYAGDDPADLYDLGGLGCSPFDGWFFVGGAICAVGSAFGALGNLVHGGYQLVLGDDVDTLLNSNSSGLDKFFAVVDIASNAVVIIPGVGEGIEAAKLAEEAGFAARKVAVRVLDKEDVRLLINKAKRTAVETLETGAEACSLCFPAGTLVATPAGERAIQTLHVGERVLAEDPQSGQVEPKPVQAVIQDSVSPLIAVELSDGSAITVTADHPFWLDVDAALGIGGWVPAGQLHAGDRLRTADGADVQVIGLQRGVGHAAVFTLTVAHDHTFFVGTARVLVHNSEGCFVNGRDFERTIETSQGPVDIVSEVIVDGETLTLKELTIYGRGEEDLTGLYREVLASRSQLLEEAKAQGFKYLRVIAHRAPHSSSANPGRLIDLTIDLATGRLVRGD